MKAKLCKIGDSMPIYEYECEMCGDRFDIFFRSVNRISNEVACPSCQSTAVQRLISAPTIRTGSTGETSTEVVDSTPAKPPVIGRKELKEAAEKKRQIKEQVQHEKMQQAKKKG
jgi:putative FmdB family regulatory protein